MGQKAPGGDRSGSYRAVEPRDNAVTVIIGQAIHSGREDDYVAWQQKLHKGLSHYPGYLGSELRPPGGAQSEWIAVYRFDSAPNAKSWLDSSSRQLMVSEAAGIFAGPASCQVIARSTEADDALMTVVVSHRVPEERVDEFLAWQKDIVAAESKFAGFRGAEMFRPVAGIQDEWTICYRFDTAEHLDAWLTSEARKQLMHHPHFRDYKMRKIDQSFGSWFVLGDETVPPPSDFKTSVAVWLGLYPTVVLLTMLLSPLRMPLWLGMLVGNLLSSFVMSYITMPYYSMPIIGWWLRPKASARQPRTNVGGMLLVVLVNGAWAVVFYLVTVRLWHP
ncbi:antibiotic biosynthesis monooxygenase [Mycobacterium marinum]|uniref:antibiotic biosynthesis monooxygenase n=1 Tax=Mycobacterium marinum TaxID=1781 RepID=UPI000B963C6D|nr:antibiotic biosynthesis monooxygenase [Mycobacterium marinum]MDC8983071.1 antibiotic biosynthesis monooxygenase [Mycobacterium marinum]MDC8994353.1 antibiotic biosynthesis monooxygenase [Mycobacterium marinum]MDC9000135.1 antibiotic biosynthesis monooxygenase [Mycobacterium marinum]MDC9010518.1 antibiotic biosynthesis monooxygenase [Mycobacterium marinum]MDC9016025.1 antibiotic biosynthesis monooxygenase [Mycobacterium marinum]